MSKAAVSAHECDTPFVDLPGEIREFVDSQTVYLFKSPSPPQQYNRYKIKNLRCNPMDIFSHVTTIATCHIVQQFIPFALVFNVRLVTS